MNLKKRLFIPLLLLTLVFEACDKLDIAPGGEGGEGAVGTEILKEAELGTLTNGAAIVDDAARSGGKYVALGGSGSIAVSLNVATEEFYDIYIRAAAPNGEKTNNIVVDGTSTSFTLQQNSTYQDYKLISTQRLRTGAHTISITPSWGWINVDYIKLISVSGKTYNIKTTLANANASTAARNLYSWMRSQFGSRTISGQTEGQAEFTYIKNLTGKTPLLRGYDMQSYSPRYSYLWDNTCNCHTFGPNPNATVVEDAIAWYNSNAKKPIIQFQWHWHSPMEGSAGTNTFYTSDTNFDVSKAVTPGTAEYTATIRDIDAIAVQLKKLQDANVPVLWRPLHEVGGTWFWWSAKGPVAFKSLWNIMYDRLTNYHQINNLIWVWNGDDANWYVGNNKCDIASIDFYGTPNSGQIVKDAYNKIYAITGGTKMLGMSENGTIPNIDEAYFQGVPWAFFMTWFDHLNSANTDAQINAVYQHPKVITLENR